MNRPKIVVLAVASLLLAACEKAEIATYRVAKSPTRQVAAAPAEPAPASPTMPKASGPSAMANTAVPTASGTGLAWTAPAHWKSRAASAMRRGSYGVPGDNNTEADLSITAFPGDVGGELANVNRWRGQISLEPITEADLPKTLTRVENNGLHIAIFDAGAGGQRTLGAMIPFNGATWFFKLTGPDALVVKEKPAFMAFVETIKPAVK